MGMDMKNSGEIGDGRMKEKSKRKPPNKYVRVQARTHARTRGERDTDRQTRTGTHRGKHSILYKRLLRTLLYVHNVHVALFRAFLPLSLLHEAGNLVCNAAADVSVRQRGRTNDAGNHVSWRERFHLIAFRLSHSVEGVARSPSPFQYFYLLQPISVARCPFI